MFTITIITDINSMSIFAFMCFHNYERPLESIKNIWETNWPAFKCIIETCAHLKLGFDLHTDTHPYRPPFSLI